MRQDTCVLSLDKALQGSKWPDTSGHGNDGVMTGARFEESYVAFDGVNDYVNCGNHSSLDLTTSFTIEVLTNPREEHGVPSGYYKLLVHKGSYWAAGYGLWMNYNSATYPNKFMIMVDGQTRSWNIPEYDRWYHVVGTFNGAVMYLYVDGVIKHSKVATLGSNNNNLLVGGGVAGRYTYNDNALVRVYSHYMTPQQVLEAYQQTYRKL